MDFKHCYLHDNYIVIGDLLFLCIKPNGPVRQCRRIDHIMS